MQLMKDAIQNIAISVPITKYIHQSIDIYTLVIFFGECSCSSASMSAGIFFVEKEWNQGKNIPIEIMMIVSG